MMFSKKPVMIATVGPTMITNNSNSAAKPMLISDRRFTPLSKPATTEIKASAVMITISTTCVVSVIGIPNRKFRPVAACDAP